VEVEAVEVHHLDPGGDEGVDELLLGVGGGVDLGEGAEQGVGAEGEVDAGNCPPGFPDFRSIPSNRPSKWPSAVDWRVTRHHLHSSLRRHTSVAPSMTVSSSCVGKRMPGPTPAQKTVLLLTRPI